MLQHLLKYTALSISIIFCSEVSADDELFEFDDQAQYELFYDYVYQLNFVEFLTTDCTSNRGVGGRFYITMGLTHEYKKIILGVKYTTDIFAGKSLASNLWGELVRGIKRDNTLTSAIDPIGFAQFKAHELIDENKEIYELVCEEIYWDEVLRLQTLSKELIHDTEKREKDENKLNRFKSASEDELRDLEAFIALLKPTEF